MKPRRPAPRRSRLSAACPLARPLRLEPLEDRRLLATITVTTLADTIDLADGQTSLREAIFAANVASGADEINFAPELFAGGAKTILLSVSELAITDTLSLVGPGADLLTIDASGNPPLPAGQGLRAFLIDDLRPTEVSVSVASLTLTGGDPWGDGGAILSREALHLIDVTFERNRAYNGGALFATGTTFIDGCTFSENVARFGGGAIYIKVGASPHVDILNSLINNNRTGFNSAADQLTVGGGICFTSDGGSFSLRGCFLLDNSTPTSGGGIFLRSRGLVDIGHTSIVGNEARTHGGASLDIRDGTASVTDSNISQNFSTYAEPIGVGGLNVFLQRGSVNLSRNAIYGNTGGEVGGLRISSGGTVVVDQCTISENLGVRDGGATFSTFGRDGSESLAIRGSTLSNNTGQLGVGGLHVLARGTVEVSHTTIFNNTSLGGPDYPIYNPVGGAFFGEINSSLPFLDHVIIAANVGVHAPGNDLISTSVLLLNYSFIGNNLGSLLTEAPLGHPDANGNLIGGPIHGAIDPLLAPLADNGGPTLPGGAKLLTHALLAGSPALDAGDPTLLAGVGDTPQFDQRGAPFSRVIGRIDVGAVEAIPETLIVDTLIDESDGNFHVGDLSLREAIELANSAAGANAIQFAPPLFSGGPKTILLTHGELAITDSLTLIGPGANLLTIDASGNDPTPDQNNGDGSRVFNVDDGVSSSTRLTVFFAGVTVTGGDSATSGGGIRSIENLTLDNVHVKDNAAVSATVSSVSGGGMFFQGLLTIKNSRVTGNTGTFGGGIFAYGLLNIDQTEVSDNHSIGQFGAGGGILARSGDARVTITRSSINNNSTRAGTGGIRIDANAALTITDSTVSGNSGVAGGGIGVRGSASRITNTSILNNTASQVGGGVWSSASLTIENSTISHNQTYINGGGIGVEGGTLRLRHSTIVENIANSDLNATGIGGGIFFDLPSRQSTISNSIIANNLNGTSSNDLYNVGGISTIGSAVSNLIGTNIGSSFAEASLGHPDANGNLIGGPIHGPVDPLLAPLADNGGPTLPGGAKLLTHALLAGSPALNAGDPASIAGVGDTPQFDQRGAPFSRVISRIDIGAVEQVPVDLLVDVLGDESDGNYAAGDLSLREAVLLANLHPDRNKITFAPAVFPVSRATAIPLTLGEIRITAPLDILGFDRSRVTIAASDPTPQKNGDGTRIFNIDDGDPNLASAVTIAGVGMRNADVAGLGGAIYSAEPLTLNNVSLGNNGAQHGGAVYAAAGLLLADSQVNENAATGDGGGVWARGAIEILRTTLQSNRVAQRGGALWLAGDVNIQNAIVLRNTANLAGGGLYLASNSALQPTSAVIHNSRFALGSAAQGGAIAWDELSFVSIVNSAIVNNTTTSTDQSLHRDGAALYGVGPLVLAYSTIVGNSPVGGDSTSAGGIRVGLAFITHSVFANSGAVANIGFLPGGHASLTYSIVGNNLGSGLAETPPGSADAQGNRIGGPIGGVVFPGLNSDGLPNANSLTVNAGNPNAAALPPELSEFDLRGPLFGRVVGGRIDIGAYEFQINGGALSADFDSSGGRIGGFDFLAWQRGFGRTTDATFAQGDATGNHKVDANDLAVWTARFGATSPPPPAAESLAAAAAALHLAPSLATPDSPSPERGGARGGVFPIPQVAALFKQAQALDLAHIETAPTPRLASRPVARQSFNGDQRLKLHDPQDAAADADDDLIDAALEALFATLC